ncbi:MAG: sensor histidine kinase [Kangiellaceae bacterium]
MWQNDSVQQLMSESSYSTKTNTRQNLSQYDLLISSVAFQIKEIEPDNNHITKITQYLIELGSELKLAINLLSKDSIPVDTFKTNNPITLNQTINGKDRVSVYYYLTEIDKIIQIQLPENHELLSFEESNQFEALFLISFYALVALVIFYWIWPLSKDLNLLQKALKNFDEENWQSRLDFPSSSPIADLARAYNQLVNKIKRMLENEKSMANSISHELRTPLARIRFALQLAKESKDQQIMVQQIESAEEDIEEMNQLIAEILSYASIDNQAFKAQLSKGDLGSLLDLLCARLTKNFPEHHIKFVNTSQSHSVLCDSILIERAIQNLIVNACKYGEQNVIVKFVESKNSYQICIANDGKMIEKNQLGKIFDAYYQIPNDEKNTGFGLGLSLVKRIADLHKGQVYAQQSNLGGAEFIFEWRK